MTATPTATVADTAAQAWAWALLLTLLRIRITQLEDQLADRDAKLAGARQSYKELEETVAECHLLHSPPRPEVRRG